MNIEEEWAKALKGTCPDLVPTYEVLPNGDEVLCAVQGIDSRGRRMAFPAEPTEDQVTVIKNTINRLARAARRTFPLDSSPTS